MLDDPIIPQEQAERKPSVFGWTVAHIDSYTVTLCNKKGTWVFCKDFDNPKAKESGWSIMVGVVSGKLMRYREKRVWLNREYAKRLDIPVKEGLPRYGAAQL